MDPDSFEAHTGLIARSSGDACRLGIVLGCVLPGLVVSSRSLRVRCAYVSRLMTFRAFCLN